MAYWISKSKGAGQGKELWVQRLAVCALQPGAGQTRFGVVPVEPGINAYVYGAIFGLIEETMVFCRLKFDAWIATDSSRTASGLHYRNLHVDIGSSPTDAQKQAAAHLLAASDFTGSSPRATRWLSDFLVQTMIHESTHSVAFTGVGNKLIDVKCENGKETQTSTDPGCMWLIAKGASGLDGKNTHGHKDAEAFAIYAVATWVNVAYWYKGYLPKDRDMYQN